MTSSDRTDLVLIETLNAERWRHHRAEYFPYLLALADAVGCTARWVVLPIPDRDMHVGARYSVALPEGARDEFSALLAELRPALIVFHDRPSVEFAEFVSTASGGGRVEDLASALEPSTRNVDLAQLLDLPAPPEDAPELLLDLERPRFDRIALSGACLPDQPVRLAGVSGCNYRRSIAQNPIYAGMDDPTVLNHLGCSFCGRALHGPADDVHTYRRALRQIIAHQRDTAHSEGRYEYIFEDFAGELWRFLDEAMHVDIRPSTFTTMVRADQLVRSPDRMNRLLEQMREGNHGLTLISIGAENFAPEENLRLNKGVTPERLWECVDLIDGWRERFPQTFSCPDTGYFSVILFTPWTRPDDLRENIAAARRLGAGWLRRAMGTRLQLIFDTPIVALARRDGLTDRRGEVLDDVVALCVSDPDVAEVPWRFADDRVARAHRLLVRLDPDDNAHAFARDEELYLDVTAHRQRLPRRLASDYIELCAAIVDAVEALGPGAPVSDVFAWIDERASEYWPDNPDGASGTGDGGPDGAAGRAPFHLVHLAGGGPAVLPQVPDGPELARPVGFLDATHAIGFPGSTASIDLADHRSGNVVCSFGPVPGDEVSWVVVVHGPDGPRALSVPEGGQSARGAICCVSGGAPSAAYLTFVRHDDQTLERLDAPLAAASIGRCSGRGVDAINLEVATTDNPDRRAAFLVPVSDEHVTPVFVTTAANGVPRAHVVRPAGRLAALPASAGAATPVDPDAEEYTDSPCDVRVRTVNLSRGVGPVVLSTGGPDQVLAREVGFLAPALTFDINSGAPQLEALRSDDLRLVARRAQRFESRRNYVAVLIDTTDAPQLFIAADATELPDGCGALRVWCGSARLNGLAAVDRTDADAPAVVAERLEVDRMPPAATVPAGRRTVLLSGPRIPGGNVSFWVDVVPGETCDAFVMCGDGDAPFAVVSALSGGFDIRGTSPLDD